MTEATGAAFVETKEYRRFREFCDACRRYRYIGLCYGPPGVGKTLSARRYADWGRVATANPHADRGIFRADEVPGNGCVFYTATVVNSPRQVEGDIDRLRGKLHDLVRQAIRTDVGPAIAAARQDLEQARDELFVGHDWLTGKPERLSRAEGAVSEAFLGQAERDRTAVDPTELVLVDEVDRRKMAGLEQLRSIFDRGGIGLVLIGMPGLERRLARYAQLYSRIGFVHEFRPLGATEVRSLLAGWRPAGVALPEDLLADAEGVAAMIRVTGGNFRLMDRLLTQVGRILELNGLKVVTHEVVEAAREVLVIGAERHSVVEGKTPDIGTAQSRALLRSIAVADPVGLRDRAVLAVLAYTAARVGAVAKLTMKNLMSDGSQYTLRFAEKGGKSREIPVRHDLEQFLLAYVLASNIVEGPLFRTANRKTKTLTRNPMTGIDVCRMMKRRLKAAGLPGHFSPHSFRVTTVTDLLEQNVPLEDVQYLAGHADPGTTRIYDRRRRKVTRNRWCPIAVEWDSTNG